MAESIHIKELNKGIRETVKGLREVTVKLTPQGEQREAVSSWCVWRRGRARCCR
mgnify:CR=1 FL=1